MAKVSVKTPHKVKTTPLPSGFSGGARAAAYFDDPAQPLHLHTLAIGRGDSFRIDRDPVDKLAYVWHGAVEAGGRHLAEGSSLIVEHGAFLEITGAAESSLLLAFSATNPSTQRRGGGSVHLLPAETVPRTDSLGGAIGLGGGMHANSECPSCELWLHENHFAGRDASRKDAEAGIHSHSEDEIIFVTRGEIRLGARLFGPGTALAIAADTLYNFTPGPDGLSFINFRAAKPGDIRLRTGKAINEPDYWHERLLPPQYLSPLV